MFWFLWCCGKRWWSCSWFITVKSPLKICMSFHLGIVFIRLGTGARPSHTLRWDHQLANGRGEFKFLSKLSWYVQAQCFLVCSYLYKSIFYICWLLNLLYFSSMTCWANTSWLKSSSPSVGISGGEGRIRFVFVFKVCLCIHDLYLYFLCICIHDFYLYFLCTVLGYLEIREE